MGRDERRAHRHRPGPDCFPEMLFKGRLISRNAELEQPFVLFTSDAARQRSEDKIHKAAYTQSLDCIFPQPRAFSCVGLSVLDKIKIALTFFYRSCVGFLLLYL